MVIISYGVLKTFYQKNPNAEGALNNWYNIVEKADWQNYHQIKEVFNSCDAIGNDRYVFNIRGNKYRLIAIIKFNAKTVYIRFIGTHADYDKINAVNI